MDQLSQSSRGVQTVSCHIRLVPDVNAMPTVLPAKVQDDQVVVVLTVFSPLASVCHGWEDWVCRLG